MQAPRNQYKGFSKIDNLIKVTAKNYKLETALYRHKALKNWQSVAGSFVQEAANLSQAIDFKKGVLIVACLSKELASKLRLLAQNIVAALNHILGKTVIFGIYIEV